jgi:hypothetical protein
MCYELRFFRSWAKQKTQTREEDTPEVVRARPDAQPLRPTPDRASPRRREVVHEPEEVL